MIEDLTVKVYSKDAIVMRVPKAQVKVPGLKANETLKAPSLCIVNDSLVAVATEWLEDEGVYLIDWDDRKIFAYNKVDASNNPEKVGTPIYLKDNAITAEKGTNLLLGYFLGMKGDAVLFKLI